MSWVNAILAAAVILVIGVSNTVTWAVTRLRNACDHYTPRHGNTEQQTDPDPAGATRPDIVVEVTS